MKPRAMSQVRPARTPSVLRQHGQASFEYVVVVAFSVMVLVIPDANGDIAIVSLANALKGFYNAFAFALSFSSTITPL